MKQENNHKVYWSLFIYDGWQFYMAATKDGLCYVGSPNKPIEEMKKWFNKKFPNAIFLQNDDELNRYKMEFEKYFNGELLEFSLPVTLLGTPFQLKVWEALKKIP